MKVWVRVRVRVRVRVTVRVRVMVMVRVWVWVWVWVWGRQDLFQFMCCTQLANFFFMFANKVSLLG